MDVWQLLDEPTPGFKQSFQVSVSTPVVVGSGYSRYTQYVISTKVRLRLYDPVVPASAAFYLIQVLLPYLPRRRTRRIFLARRPK